MTEEKKSPNKETAEAAPAEKAAAPADDNNKSAGRKGHQNKKKSPRRGGNQRGNKDGVDVELEERVVAVNRVAKVVKGGRRFSFAALMVVGDKKGRVGYGLGKAKEVPEAIRKATQVAKKKMITVPLDKGTIPHEIYGLYDAGKILFKPAADGTGVKAAGACRTILELAGYTNVLTKSVRGNNPHNIVKATFDALKNLRTASNVAAARGKESKGIRTK